MTRVMVVDDEVPIRQWLEFCINRLDGYEIAGSAANGAEGFSLFRKLLPDVVITDIRMPVMDGLEMLKMIQTVDPSVITVVLTSHEDFSYAREAIKIGAFEYILKTEITEENLSDLLMRANQQRMGLSKSELEKSEDFISKRNHYLRSLVWNRNQIVVSEAIVKEYGITLQKGCFVAIDIMEEDNVLQSKWNKPDFLINVMKVPLDLRHTMLIGNIDKNLYYSMEKQREMLRSYCEGIVRERACKIGCSDLGNNISYMGEIMKQAYERAMQYFYFPKQSIFMVQETGNYTIQNGEKYRIQFSKELLNQDWEKLENIKNSMMQEVREQRIVDIDTVKKLYLFFAISLFHLTRENTESIQKEIETIEEKIQLVNSLDELEKILQDGFEICRGKRKQFSQYSMPICRAISYIEAHYMEAITLSDVASSVGLSAEYMSRLFKEETGIKFVVYLNNIRLKQALHLLENTTLKVYEIAEAVGYSNLSYFSTLFKKNFGQNPFDYRNSFNKKLS